MKIVGKRFRGIGIALSALFLALVVLRLMPFPELKLFLNRRYSTRVFDCEGRLIYVLPLQEGLRREFVPYNKIPSEVRRGILNAEDKRFWFHFGIDCAAVFRALIQNVQGKKNISGASTVSMQLAKIISPSKHRNFKAKLKDSFNALRLEIRFSKKKIFELYINNLPFGQNCEGIASAARMYFSKDLDELSESEIQFLSKIPRNPSLYSPVKRSLLYENKISTVFPHYMEYLKKNYDSVFADCYEVQLYCDLDAQIFAENVLRTALESAKESRIFNGSLYALDVQTGGVVVWVGSQEWEDDSNSGQIDGVLNLMQPGSSMKPFLYAASMEHNSYGKPLLQPTDVLADVPKSYGSENAYIPQNFNNRYNGPIRARVALASSLNVPAVDLLDKIGLQNYVDVLSSLGFKELEDSGERCGLSLALGAGEVSIKKLTEAFSVFTRDGKYIPAQHFKKKIFLKKHRHSKDLETAQIFQTDTARIICSFLSDKKSRSLGFGYAQSFETEYPSIFKTGTSNQFQNITALGATKEFAVGAWMGNFNGHTVIGKTGSSLPAWQVRSILDFLEKRNGTPYEKLKLPEPEGYHLECICSLSGKKPSAGCKETVFEYVKNGSELSLCDWHVVSEKSGETEICFPAEYQQWFLNYASSGKVNYDSDLMKIETPKNGSVFYYDSLKKVNQVIPFEVTGGHGETLFVYENGNLVLEKERPFSFSVPAVPGSHRVVLRCGEEEKVVEYLVK